MDLDLNFENHGGKIAERKEINSAADFELFGVKMAQSQLKPTNLHIPTGNVDENNFDATSKPPQPDVNRTNNLTIREEDDKNDDGWTKTQQWGYAVLANSFNVCLALSGIMIVKCSNGGNRRVLGDFFLGLAVSIMLGDSLLHIMPEVLGT